MKCDTQDLEFLKECICITDVVINRTNVLDYSGIYYLINLVNLCLGDGFNKRIRLDISRFTNLRGVFIEGDIFVDGISDCKKIREVGLWKYKPDSRNLTAFTGLVNLKELRVTQSTINSLSGCSGSKKLIKLELNYLRNLEFINEIERNANTLKELELTNCPNLKNHEYVSCLKKLESLRFTNCGEIKSLDFIRSMPSLKKISFVDTNIIDGDLSPCIGLDFIGFNDKRHYSHKFKDLNPKVRLC